MWKLSMQEASLEVEKDNELGQAALWRQKIIVRCKIGNMTERHQCLKSDNIPKVNGGQI